MMKTLRRRGSKCPPSLIRRVAVGIACTLAALLLFLSWSGSGRPPSRSVSLNDGTTALPQSPDLP